MPLSGDMSHWVQHQQPFVDHLYELNPARGDGHVGTPCTKVSQSLSVVLQSQKWKQVDQSVPVSVIHVKNRNKSSHWNVYELIPPFSVRWIFKSTEKIINDVCKWKRCSELKVKNTTHFDQKIELQLIPRSVARATLLRKTAHLLICCFID